MFKINLLLSLTLGLVNLTSCNHSAKDKEIIQKEVFGTHQGQEVYLFTLTNKSGNVIRLTNYGAKITWIEVPDKSGKKENITLGYDTFKGTITGDKSFGSVIGRFAGGIAKGKFTIDGVEYTLTNNGCNHILSCVVWNAEVLKKSEFPAVKFTYISPDMEGGFPGTMTTEVTYTWTDRNEIIMEYTCSTDKKTVMNITNHAYFNLHGAGNGDILDHELVIKAAAFTPIDSDMITTGEIRPVSGTPLDFTTKHTIGERIDMKDEQIVYGKGYDHNFVLDNNEEVDVTVYEPVSGRLLEVITDQPGMVLYTGNFLDGKQIGHGGKPYNFRSGLCLESCHFPDSPNHSNFPTTELKPGEKFQSITIYRFSVK